MAAAQKRYPFQNALHSFFFLLRKERIFGIIGVTCLILFAGAVSILLLERPVNKSLSGLGDALYWAIISMTTTGYGDITPFTPGGRVVAIIIVISGIILLSIVTSTVTSIFVEKKIREGKGLETIKFKGHTVICGWNGNATEVIDALLRLAPAKGLKLVFINELPEGEIEALRYRYREEHFKFLRGDFTQEEVLTRANIQQAGSAILLADTSGQRSLEKADDRTILATLAIKSLAPEVKTCAELLNMENRVHLKRANVDEIIVRGEHLGSLLAGAAASPGLPRVFFGLLSPQEENKLWKVPIPASWVGKTAGELAAYFKKEHQALLIGLLSEQKGLGLEQILTDDYSAIDQFIKRKFEEAGKNLLRPPDRIMATLNPPDDRIITAEDAAVVLARKRP